jgi:hypothetical protein
MASVAHHVRRFLRDSIVARVCVFICGGISFALGVWITSAFRPADPYEWLAVVLSLTLVGFAIFMVYASVFGRLRLLEKATNAVSDGGEVLGVVLLALVFLAALPISTVVKLVRKMRRHL